MTTLWAPTETRTRAEQVYRAVRTRIMEGALAPGTFLREKDLESLGVSRTPIREALGRLASEGFLERLPHRGFRVPEESLAHLLELYPIVASLELLAGRLALETFTSADLDELKAVNRRLAEARDRGDARGMLELNTAFHRAITERGDQPRALQLLEQNMSLTYRSLVDEGDALR